MRTHRFALGTTPAMLAALATALATAFATTAAAQPITITNAGFEAPPLGDGGGVFTVVPGWTIAPIGAAGVLNPNVTRYAGGNAPQGQNIAVTLSLTGGFTGTMSQTLGAPLMPNTTYTLSYLVGHSLASPFGAYVVNLLAGGTTLATDLTSVTPTAGQFLPATLVFTSPATGPLLGQALGIQFGLGAVPAGSETDFDTFTLTASASPPGPPPSTVPEPGPLALLALGCLALGAVRRGKVPASRR